MFYLRFKLNLLHKIIDYLLIVLNHIAVKLRVLTFYCHLQTLRQRPDSTDTTAMKNEITKNQTSHVSHTNQAKNVFYAGTGNVAWTRICLWLYRVFFHKHFCIVYKQCLQRRLGVFLS